MRVFEELCPKPPDWRVPWAEIREAFDWVRALSGVPQDPVHHAEGDVEVHTRMACEALAELPQWRARPADERVRLFTTVLMHDIAKPFSTQIGEDGRITARGHSRGGDVMVRRTLWEMGASAEWREHVAALVRHHQVPFWALERDDLQRIVFRVSLLARNDDMVLLSTADALGRVSSNTEEVLENVGLYGEYCAEQGCLGEPRKFPSDHSRFWYFRKPGRDPDYLAYDDTRCTVTVMSGLPGVGKDHWIRENRPGLPVVSLDAIRREMGISPSGDQRPVAAAAHERARGHLRAGRSFVWNATNVSRMQREQCTGLIADYQGRVELVALEAPREVLLRRNRARSHPVPEAVIDRLLRRWEAPDPTEAHTVHWLSTA